MDGKQNTTRSPWDGKPYYCVTCGLGFAEFIACEDGDCKLEGEASAQARADAAEREKARERENTIRTITRDVAVGPLA